jgi:hypothetical protein
VIAFAHQDIGQEHLIFIAVQSGYGNVCCHRVSLQAHET